jgi:hypothetical protein
MIMKQRDTGNDADFDPGFSFDVGNEAPQQAWEFGGAFWILAGLPDATLGPLAGLGGALSCTVRNSSPSHAAATPGASNTPEPPRPPAAAAAAPPPPHCRPPLLPTLTPSSPPPSTHKPITPGAIKQALSQGQTGTSIDLKIQQRLAARSELAASKKRKRQEQKQLKRGKQQPQQQPQRRGTGGSDDDSEDEEDDDEEDGSSEEEEGMSDDEREDEDAPLPGELPLVEGSRCGGASADSTQTQTHTLAGSALDRVYTPRAIC